MNEIDFLDQISGCAYMFFDREGMVVYEWNGSQTVNIWTLSRGGAGQFTFYENTDMFMSDFTDEVDPLDAVKQAIDHRVNHPEVYT